MPYFARTRCFSVRWVLLGAMVSAGANANAQDALRLGPGKSKKKEAVKAPLATEPSEITKTATIAPVEVTPAPGESIEDAWNSLFLAKRGHGPDAEFQAGVRAKIRRLLAKEDFEQIRFVISAALRNDAAKPWMYEALALALEASKAPEKELERVLLSSVDVSRDVDSALTTAAYLAAIHLDRSALRLFEDVASQDPLRQEPYLQGLRCAQNLKDPAAIQWCCLGILKQAWPTDQKEVEQHARRVAEANLVELEKAGKKALVNAFKSELAAALARDVRVRIWWTGDADVDLSVLEPTGEVCSYRNPNTTGGGLIQGDVFSRSSVTSPRDGYSETFLCSEGFTGEYQVFLKRVWGEVTGGKVNVEVITHYGAKDEEVISKQLPLGKDGTLVQFKLANGRRSESLPEARASFAAGRQTQVARHVLAQQFSGSGSESAAQAYNEGNKVMFTDPFGRLAFPLARGGVGFRPQLTNLQDGPQLTAGPAVVSADRRFVRMTLSPVFQTIGEVQTFNFASGSVGNGNGSGNTNTGGGGAGGGGAGGGTGT